MIVRGRRRTGLLPPPAPLLVVAGAALPAVFLVLGQPAATGTTARPGLHATLSYAGRSPGSLAFRRALDAELARMGRFLTPWTPARPATAAGGP